MKKIACIGLTLMTLAGCAGKVQMPTIDLPTPPQKPAIKTVIVPKGDDFLIGYTMPDALRLYEYLVEQDSYGEKLRYRINVMNQLWKGR